MTTPFKNPVKNFALIFFTLISTFIWGCGCTTSKPIPDPLAGWQKAYKEEPNQIIEKDYNDFIQKFSPTGQRSAQVIGFFKDGTGQHAIKLQIGINGTEWMHVLIYDKDNKRIKTIKYSIGHYAS